MNKQEIEKAIEDLKRLKQYAEILKTPEEFFKHMQGHRTELSFVLRAFEVTEMAKDIQKVLEHQLTNGWIPVSERLPEEEKVYLISLKDECQEIIGFGIYDIEKKSWYADWLKNTEWIKQKVIIMAWQPLPEPYKAKELN